MIKVITEMKEKCERCKEFNPRVEMNTAYAGKDIAFRTVTVRCEHQKLCDFIEKELEDNRRE